MQFSVSLATVSLLTLSNILMTFAWYGHLRCKNLALPQVIFSSWGIAFFGHMLRVPVNRIGYGYFSAAELKTVQEVISLTVLMLFSTFSGCTNPCAGTTFWASHRSCWRLGSSSRNGKAACSLSA
ncbi:DMT family protein [uncultured Desulfovibrio sp.]|uniref:DMT family protein n=1 Tax=uncultured Desulfovibrio sp. TaxID=167968 RepID=UPI0003A40474|nr:DMT family protein [uncultured Desulfovibrio sp.]